MPSTAVTSPNAATTHTDTRPRWRARLRGAWTRLTLSDEERFLHGASSLADLEARLRRLERGREDRFGPLPPTL